VLAGLALVLAGAGTAAALPSADGAITGCVNARGALRVVETTSQCDVGETALTWNQHGQPGSQGAPGPQGVPGPAGPEATGIAKGAQDLADIASGKIPPPAGLSTKTPAPARSVTARLVKAAAAKVDAYSTFKDGQVPLGGGSAQAITVAALALPPGDWVIQAKTNAHAGTYPGGTHLSVICQLQAGADFDRAYTLTSAPIATQVVHRFAKPGLVELRCHGFRGSVAFTKITAVRSAGLSNRPAN
jgi:hypothetical protein